MTEQLQRMPDIRIEYLKALASLARRPKGQPTIPVLSLELPGVQADPTQLRAYRQICGFADQGSLPITYLQVLAAPMQIRLLARPGFPLPLLGLVHLRNDITQDRALAEDERGVLTVATGASRQTDKGLEFEMITSFRDQRDAEVWKAVATLLFRNRPSGGGGRKPGGQEAEAQAAEYLPIEAPEDLGRRYGRISGDMNPIHLRPWTAKLFGFKRHIAHGMWSLARSAAFLEGRLGRMPRQLSVQFRQPLFLPAGVALRHKSDAGVIEFALLNRNSGKIHLEGALR